MTEPINPKTRLPKFVRFPWGYRIRVVQVNSKDIEGCYADWDCTTRTIRIRRSLSMKRKRYLLAHELVHAGNDFMHALLDLGLARTTP